MKIAGTISEGRAHLRPPAPKKRIVRRIFCRVLLTLAVAGFAALAPSPSPAHSLHPTQDDVEAAYLYNFGKFVQWPGNHQNDPLNICVLGHDPFGATLDSIVANETIDGRHLAVVRLTDPAAGKSCAILFMASSESARAKDELSRLGTAPIVTVSDMPGFAEQGGMIQFVLRDGRVRFTVNLDAATRCGVAFSSQLLKVAAQVVGPAQGKATK